MQRCPSCNGTLMLPRSSMPAVPADTQPVVGDVGVCDGCGAFLVIDEKMEWQLADDTDREGLTVEQRHFVDSARAFYGKGVVIGYRDAPPVEIKMARSVDERRCPACNARCGQSVVGSSKHDVPQPGDNAM